MWRTIFKLSLTTLLLVGSATAADRPNIVVILVDDMGFSDIGCYGSEIPTPNIDSLAKGGIKFSQFYNTGRCCPTRASLLTGLYAHQTGVGHMNADYKLPGYRGVLNKRCVTFGTIARRAGYLSAMTGKWHVGHRRKSNYPRARGFDRFYGIPQGGGFYFKTRNSRTVELNDTIVGSEKIPLPDHWYSTTAWVDEGLKFVDEAIAADKPFLWYLAHNAPHFPLQATAADIQKFKGKFKDGWDKLSARRHKRQVALGLIDQRWTKAKKSKHTAGWNTLSAEKRDRQDHLMAAYAACVSRIDQSVGTLIETLKQRRQFDNTVIMFMSDNGGSAEGGQNGRTLGDPTTAGSNWYCSESWAWMQNTPFRKYKFFNHEGGIATPLIIHWPNGIQSNDKWQRQPAHVIDIMPTIVELIGATYPKVNSTEHILPMEGVSLVPTFTGKLLEREEPLYWEHEGNAAIRVGKWKLVRSFVDEQWELYNMHRDRTEQSDVASKHPAVAQGLARRWHQWAKRCGVKPDGLP
jgi:arylsulfatase